MIRRVLPLILALLAATPALAFSLGKGKPAPAPQAQQQQPQADKPDPLFPIQDEAGFAAVAKERRSLPFNEAPLEFSITLPEDWKAGQASQSQIGGTNRRILSEVARFLSPYVATMQSILTVHSVRLDREISAEDWLKNYLNETHCILEGQIEAPSERRAGASCSINENGRSTFFSIAFILNGDDALLARFSSPFIINKKIAFVRKKVIDSFHFVLPSDSSIEAPKDFSFPDAFRLTYPANWKTSGQDISDISRMSTRLLSSGPDGRLEGMIRVSVIRRGAGTNLVKETDKIRDYVNGALNTDVKRLVSSGKADDAPAHFIFSRYEVYQVAPRKSSAADQELRLAVLGDKEWYVIAFMISPTQSDNFLAWARNKQAFNMILRRIQ